MRAFVIPSFSDLHVRINLAGREADGVVPADDHEMACDEVEAIFRSCRNPRTGNPVVAEVLRPRQGDPFADVGFAADVVVTWAEDADCIEHPTTGVVGPYPAWRTSGHSTHGFAIVAGPEVEPGRSDGHRVVDLPPLLLAHAGVAAGVRR
jgi:predicted AlkP superfamily phosphohydrolase/phosphomutase